MFLPRAIEYPSEFTETGFRQNAIPVEDFGRYVSVSLDSECNLMNGIYQVNKPKIPTAASQIHPNESKKFGYFLPRISVKVK